MTFRGGSLRGFALAALAAAALGCGGPEVQPVTASVRAPNPAGEVVPIVGLDLTLLPFDIDSLYRTLEEKNQSGPKPSAEPIEVLYQDFFAADTGLLAADSVLVARQAELEPLTDRASQQYRDAFNAYERAQGRRDSVAAARDSAQAVYAPAREDYNRRLQTWEGSAWDGFEDAQENLYAAVEAPRDSAGEEIAFKHRTGEDGTFKISVAPGRWWLAGRIGVPGSVHEVYRWNVPFRVEDQPVTVELTGENAEVLNSY